MHYSIYFINKNNLYVEVGFKNRREAKSKLEEIANCFPEDSAVGEIVFRDNYINKTTQYLINYENKKAFLKYKSSKKALE
ncbi:MAG: hypothetical protein QW404_01185 [Candidatus Nanoarchaeia archaeon]